MFFLYELVEKLKDSGFNSGTISRFEMDYFVIGAQQHNEIELFLHCLFFQLIGLLFFLR